MKQIKCPHRKVTVSAFAALLILAASMPVSALKNPAAVYCTELGYEYMVAQTKKGNLGLCKLPDDRLVDAWSFLQGKVAREYSYCLSKGYEMKTVKDNTVCASIFSSDCSVCILPGGNEVEVALLMNLTFVESTCGDGSCGLTENYSTCPGDCPSGGMDDYCDGLADQICDPDCEEDLDRSDPDCMDRDKDGIPDGSDNCREVANPDQRDSNAGEDDNTSLAGIQHYGNACDTDYSNNGFTGLEDFNELRTCFGKSAAGGCEDVDCDGNGFIGLEDFNCLRTYFGKAPGPGIGD